MQLIEINNPDKQQEEDIIVGIDFGTTHSLIAHSKESKPYLIKIDDSYLIKSIIGIDNDKVTIGKTCDIKSIKRLLGKSSEEIKNNPTLNNLSDIIILDEKLPKILLHGQKVTLPVIASEIFKYLKNKAELQLETKIKKAVISVPAYFDNSAKGQILLSAKLAGLDVVRLISEPTAAAYAYDLDKFPEGIYLVYDYGGGTFDISILNMTSGIFQVIGISGDNNLGGDDIDITIAQYVSKEANIPLTKELISLSKQAKEDLTTKQNIILKQISISRNKFEEIISPLIDRTIKLTKLALEEANNSKLDGIILVGGSSRIPLIKRKLLKFSRSIYSNIEPEKIVALGTAKHANTISTRSGALLLDATPLSLGIELYGGIVEKIITRNTQIPYSVSQTFTTNVDNQTGIKFHIVQGEREMAEDCRSLAHFELTNIPPMKAGKAKIEVTFAIDTNNILSVTTQEKTSHISHNLEINPTYEMTQKEINDILSDAFSNAETDHNQRLLLEAKQKGDYLILSLEKSLSCNPDILSNREKKDLDSAMNILQNLLKSNDRNAIIEQINSLNLIAEKLMEKILNKNADSLKNRHIDEIDY